MAFLSGCFSFMALQCCGTQRLGLANVCKYIQEELTRAGHMLVEHQKEKVHTL